MKNKKKKKKKNLALIKRMFNPTVILVTGVQGFIGSHLVVNLVQQFPTIQFIGIDKETYCSNSRHIEEISDSKANNFTYIKLDLLEIDELNKLFIQYPIDTVIHLAAYSHVDLSFQQSLLFTHNNIVATHHLLEVSRIHQIKRFIYFSTDEVYGTQYTYLNEDGMLDPTNPYAASKAAADMLSRSYYHSYKLPVIVTRCNNVFGPKQYPEKVIPKFICRLLQGKPCQIHGSGQQKRSFLYVDDVVQAVSLILFSGAVGEIYNIGSSQEITIEDLANRLIRALQPEAQIESIPDRIFNDQHYRIRSDKITALGWKQKISFDDGLEKTIAWYRQHWHWYPEV
jgi:dTDP-glucose 4,6-dehydratase